MSIFPKSVCVWGGGGGGRGGGDGISTRGIDSFHIVSAHVPNCLVPRYLREITLENANFIRLPIRYTMEYGKDEKKNKFANKD